MKTTALIAALLTLNFQLATLNCFSQANEPGSGNCLSFDGVDDYVEVGDNNFPLGNTPRTISAWFNPQNTMKQSLIGYGLPISGDPLGERITISTATDGVAVAVSGCNYGNNNLSLSGWHHVAIVFPNGGTTCSDWKIYLDGKQISASVIAGVSTQIVDTKDKIASIGKTIIGVLNSNSWYYGQIDEVRIWNYARSITEIQEDLCQKLTGTEPGLVGYWRMDEGSGNTAFDSSPNTNDGTLY